MQEAIDIAISEFEELSDLRDRIEFHVPSKAVSKKDLVKISECAWPEISLAPRTILDIVIRSERETSLPPRYLEVPSPGQLTLMRRSSSSPDSKRGSDDEDNQNNKLKRRSFMGISLK